MEILANGCTLEVYAGGFPLSTDSVLLSQFVKLPKNARVLDLGSGCGTLGLLLCARDAQCAVSGIEIDPAAHEAALGNIERNQLSHRMESTCADLRDIKTLVKPGSCHCCVSNPPYFAGGPASQTVPSARREDLCSMSQLFQAAAWAVKYGGDFFVVHRPERLAQLFACAASVSLEPKRLCLVRHKADGPVTLVLIQCRKGAKPGLTWEELCLHDGAGNPTEAYKQIYHL